MSLDGYHKMTEEDTSRLPDEGSLQEPKLGAEAAPGHVGGEPRFFLLTLTAITVAALADILFNIAGQVGLISDVTEDLLIFSVLLVLFLPVLYNGFGVSRSIPMRLGLSVAILCLLLNLTLDVTDNLDSLDAVPIFGDNSPLNKPARDTLLVIGFTAFLMTFYRAIAELARSHAAVSSKALELAQENRQRSIAEAKLRARDEEQAQRLRRIERKQAAIMALSTDQALANGDLAGAAHVITEAVGEAMGVERVSIWLLDAGELSCVDLFDRGAACHTSGTVLHAIDAPAYFEAIAAARTVAADNALGDARTRELAENYLEPLGISSMLDAPVRVHGTTVGVVCHEQVGAPRQWQTDEIAFAGTVADQVAQVLTNAERKCAEENLRQSEARYRLLVENVELGITLMDADFNLLMVNGAYARLLGKTPEELLGAKCWEIARNDSGVCPDCPAVQAMETGQAQDSEQDIVLEDGRRPSVRVRTFPVLDGNERPRGFVEIAEDITEVKRLEEERRALDEKMQHAQKLESLGVLAGGIAHDFNNSLVAILGNAELAMSSLTAESPVYGQLQDIDRASQRAAELAQQLLAYAGKGRFAITHLTLNDLLASMTNVFDSSIAKNAVITYDYAQNLPPVEGDETQLRQVAMNLITNASEALGGQAGTINVATGTLSADRIPRTKVLLGEDLPTGPCVFLRITDTGCGMDHKTQQRIFDPFYSTKFTGRGLGLAALLGIVRGHHGAVGLQSEPGEGTTVTIYLPVLEGAKAAARERSVPPQWRGEGTVLLVDDEKIVRAVGGRMLERVGFAVVSAAGGEEALDIFRDRADEFCCVLLDLTMPRMGGKETFEAMRMIRPEVPVVLCTGYTEEQIDEQFSRDELAGVLLKPYKIKSLRKALCNATRSS